MISFYRIEFVHGPHDGLVVEADTLVATRLRLPAPQNACPSPSEPAPLYELSQKSLRWDDGTPQAVLRYEFRGEMTQADANGLMPLRGRMARWLAERRQQLTRWMMTPIDYPMTTRSSVPTRSNH
jgi:hypothetical protein